MEQRFYALTLGTYLFFFSGIFGGARCRHILWYASLYPLNKSSHSNHYYDLRAVQERAFSGAWFQRLGRLEASPSEFRLCSMLGLGRKVMISAIYLEHLCKVVI